MRRYNEKDSRVNNFEEKDKTESDVEMKWLVERVKQLEHELQEGLQREQQLTKNNQQLSSIIVNNNHNQHHQQFIKQLQYQLSHQTYKEQRNSHHKVKQQVNYLPSFGKNNHQTTNSVSFVSSVSGADLRKKLTKHHTTTIR